MLPILSLPIPSENAKAIVQQFVEDMLSEQPFSAKSFSTKLTSTTLGNQILRISARFPTFTQPQLWLEEKTGVDTKTIPIYCPWTGSFNNWDQPAEIAVNKFKKDLVEALKLHFKINVKIEQDFSYTGEPTLWSTRTNGKHYSRYVSKTTLNAYKNNFYGESMGIESYYSISLMLKLTKL